MTERYDLTNSLVIPAVLLAVAVICISFINSCWCQDRGVGHKQVDNAQLVIGAYQVYRTRDDLWIIADVDRIIERESYSEPPTENRLACVRVFRVTQKGQIASWSLPAEEDHSANENFTYLAVLGDSVFVMCLRGGSSFKLTDSGRPLDRAVAISTRDIVTKVQFSSEAQQTDVHERVRMQSEDGNLHFARSDVYGMSRSALKIPDGLVGLDVILSGNRNGWGAVVLKVKSKGPGKEWTKTLLDLGAAIEY